MKGKSRQTESSQVPSESSVVQASQLPSASYVLQEETITSTAPSSTEKLIELMAASILNQNKMIEESTLRTSSSLLELRQEMNASIHSVMQRIDSLLPTDPHARVSAPLVPSSSEDDSMTSVAAPTSVMGAEQINFLLQAGQSVTAVRPQLKGTGVNHIKNFLRDYDLYSVQCPSNLRQRMIQGVSLEIRRTLVRELDVEFSALDNISNADLTQLLIMLHPSRTAIELMGRLESISMAQSASLSALDTYIRDFEFALASQDSLRGKGNLLPPRTICSLFCERLWPLPVRGLVTALRLNELTEVEKAASRALREHLQNVAYQKSSALLEARMGKPSPPAKQPNTPKKSEPKDSSSQSKSDSKSESKAPEKRSEGKSDKDKFVPICYHCGVEGHSKKNCPSINDHKPDVGPPASHLSPGSKAKIAGDRVVKENNKCLAIFNGTEFSSTDIPTDTIVPPSPDGLVRIPVALGSYHGVTVNTTLFLDGGANMNSISKSTLDKLRLAGWNGSTQQGPAITVKTSLVNTFGSLSGEFVLLDVILPVLGHKLLSEIKFIVHPSAADPLVLGLPSMQDLGLTALYQKDFFVSSSDTVAPEDEELQPFLDAMSRDIILQQHTLVSVTSDGSAPVPVVPTTPQYVVADSFPQKETLLSLLNDFAPLFGPLDSTGLLVPPMQLLIKPDSVLPQCHTRFVKPELMEPLRLALEDMVAKQVIRPVTDAICASPLVLVQAPKKEMRVAVDYTMLNLILLAFAWRLPDMYSLFPFLRGMKYFARFDNLSGYFQLGLDPSGRYLTTITTPFGLFEFLRCPFGISTAPGVYQHRMSTVVLAGLTPAVCVVFIDDTLTYGRTLEEFMTNLRLVLEAFRKHNVRLKASKCAFGVDEVQFLGHIFNSEGITMVPSTLESLLQRPSPTDLRQLQSTLGLINFFRDFVPKCSLLTAPFSSKLSASKWSWTSEDEALLCSIKDVLRECGKLYYLLPDGEIVLYTDASKIGCGGALIQFQGDAGPRAICYVSKKFSLAAQRWNVTEQELYGVVFAILSLKSYLLGRHFTVATDHRNLVYLHNSDTPKVIRWRLALSEFSFVIRHIPGATNGLADALSRQANAMIMVNDQDYDHVELLKSLHNSIVGHHGVTRLLHNLDVLDINWSNRSTDVANFVRCCPICQKVKPIPIPSLPPSTHNIQGSSAMDNIHIDTIGPLPTDIYGNSFILVLICSFSKFCTLFPTVSTEAADCVRALLQHIGLFGLMSFLRSDGGSQFTANIIKEVTRYFAIDHHVIVAYHPQANGLVERRNAEVMKHLRAIVLDRRVKDNWSTYLPIVQNIVNSAFDSSINTYPSRVIFGDSLKLSFQMVFGNKVTPTHEGMDDYILQLNEAIALISDASRCYLEAKIAARAAKGKIQSTSHHFAIRDYVLLEYPNRAPHKLSPIYRGPLIIVDHPSDNIFVLGDILNDRLLTVHEDRLRYFHVAADVYPEELQKLAAADHDSFFPEEILAHRGNIKNRSTVEFLVRWVGLDAADDTWEKFSTIKNVGAFMDYINLHPDVKKGLKL